MEYFLRKMDLVLRLFFRVHDLLSGWLVRYMRPIKVSLWVVAWVMLLGIFFPESRRTMGEWSLDVLLVILFLSPLAKIFRMRFLILLMGYRRELGILFATMALAHGSSLLFDPVWFGANISPYVPDSLFLIPARFLTALVALTLTIPLLLTSNSWMNRMLGRNWKRLHMLVYPLFVLVVFHKFFIGRGGEGTHSLSLAWIQSLLVIGLYVLLKLLAWKPSMPLLESVKALVAARYRNFQSETKVESVPAIPVAKSGN